jgi:hypothetical protein
MLARSGEARAHHCSASPRRYRTEKYSKIMCEITHLVRATPYSRLHHFRSNTSESRTPSRSSEVGIVIYGTRKYGVKGRRDGEKRVFISVKHGLGSRREGIPRHGGRSSRWHACKRRLFAASFLLSCTQPRCILTRSGTRIPAPQGSETARRRSTLSPLCRTHGSDIKSTKERTSLHCFSPTPCTPLTLAPGRLR